MELFAFPNPDLPPPATRLHGFRQVRYLEGRDLRDIGLSAAALRQSLEDQVDGFVQGYPESGHPGVGDGQFSGAVIDQLLEEWDDRSPASGHIAVPDDGKTGVVAPGIRVGGDEELVRSQLGGAVEIDRIDSLVRGQGHNARHSAVDGGVADVLGSVDVGLDRLEGVVLADRHMLQRRSVDDVIHPVEGPKQPVLVPYVPDKIPHTVVVFLVRLPHDILLVLVPGIDDNLLRIEGLENPGREPLPEGAGTPGDKYSLTGQHCPYPSHHFSEPSVVLLRSRRNQFSVSTPIRVKTHNLLLEIF